MPMEHYAPAVAQAGPFVYRLGRKIFILERGVRFSYGLLFNKKTKKKKHNKKWQTINLL